MLNLDPDTAMQFLQGTLQPWFDSIENPQNAQERVLHNLLNDYAKSAYGQKHNATQIDSIDDYRRVFPIATYEDYRPYSKKIWLAYRAACSGKKHSAGRSRGEPPKEIQNLSR